MSEIKGLIEEHWQGILISVIFIVIAFGMLAPVMTNFGEAMQLEAKAAVFCDSEGFDSGTANRGYTYCKSSDFAFDCHEFFCVGEKNVVQETYFEGSKLTRG